MALLGVNETTEALVVRFVSARILDEATILEIGNDLLSILERARHTKRMVLDFERVQFMSSAMIGKLVLLNKKAKAEQIDLRLRHVQPNVLDVLKLTRLNKLFTIESLAEPPPGEAATGDGGPG